MRIQLIRFELLREVAKLESKVEPRAPAKEDRHPHDEDQRRANQAA
jgi:hypothetical protein